MADVLNQAYKCAVAHAVKVQFISSLTSPRNHFPVFMKV